MMLKRKSALDLIRHLLAVVILLVAPPSFALDFSNSVLVYSEDFDGETGFPTAPEVNIFSIGDNSAAVIDGGSNLIGFLAPVGGVVPISISGETPLTNGNIFIPGDFQHSVGMRSVFHNFSMGVAPADGIAAAGVSISFGTTFQTTTSVLDATLLIDRTGGVITGWISSQYNEPPAATVVSYTPLATSELNAVLAGASFTVDLALDKETLIATASVDIEGEGEFAATPFDLSAISGITPLSRLSANQFGAIEYLGADLDVEIDDVSIFAFSPPTPVPTLGLMYSISLGGLLLGAGLVRIRAVLHGSRRET